MFRAAKPAVLLSRRWSRIFLGASGLTWGFLLLSLGLQHVQAVKPAATILVDLAVSLLVLCGLAWLIGLLVLWVVVALVGGVFAGYGALISGPFANYGTLGRVFETSSPTICFSSSRTRKQRPNGKRIGWPKARVSLDMPQSFARNEMWAEHVALFAGRTRGAVI